MNGATEGRVIADYITPSEEILDDEGNISTRNLLDEVDLYNLNDEADVPEKNAEQILRITYPTRTLETIIKRTTEKFDPEAGLHDGAHIIGGGYGSGKSHIGLVLYHLFDQPSIGQTWLDENDIDSTLPDKTQVSALQMLNLDTPKGETYTRLWEPIYEQIGAEDKLEDLGGGVPTYKDIREAVGDTPTLLFIDELERWLNISVRRKYKEDNLAFLQNLMETAERKDTPLAVFVSLLYDDLETNDIAGRTNPFTHNLTARRDEKIQFITHRLVGSRDNPEGIEGLAREYIEAYEESDLIDLEDYQDLEERIQDYYPFHPYALDLLMRKFTGARSNDARGLLSFLTEVLADNYERVDFLLTGDVDVYRNQILDRLYAIDTDLLPKYEDDYGRLKGDEGFDLHVEQLLNIVLLYSLSEAGEVGANRRELLMGSLRPDLNSHELIQTFTDKIAGYAWHIHKINGEFSFDTNENPAARIEKKAEDVHKNDAIHRIENLVLEEMFGERESVHIWNPINTEQEIDDTKGLQILIRLDYQRSYDKEFAELVKGREFPNTLIVVSPDGDIQTNTGIIKMAKNVVAGEQLNQQGGELPEGFGDIHGQNYSNLLERVQEKFGSINTPTQRRGKTRLVPEDLSVRDGEDYYDAVIRKVSPDESDISKSVRSILQELGASGLQYKFLLKDFYKNVEYPIITDADEFEETLKDLCSAGELSIDGTIDTRPSSVGSNSTIIHGDYTSTPDTGGSSTGGETGLTTDTGTNGGSSGGSGTTTTSITSTTSTTSREDDDDEPTVETWPSVPPHEATNKYTLIDELDREMGDAWVAHVIKITIDADLLDADLSRYGLGDYNVDNTELRERFVINTENNPMTKRRLLDLIEDLDVPSNAALKFRMEVNKNE